MSAYFDSELQRAQGAGRIVLDGCEHGTRIVDVFQQHPIRIMFPRHRGAGVEDAVIVNARAPRVIIWMSENLSSSATSRSIYCR